MIQVQTYLWPAVTLNSPYGKKSTDNTLNKKLNFYFSKYCRIVNLGNLSALEAIILKQMPDLLEIASVVTGIKV
jgi:hypothetical protein